MKHNSPGLLKEKLQKFSRVGFLQTPTPLEPLPRLSTHLGGPKLWVKREDCIGFGFGGNKLRKLDFVLPEAIKSGSDTIVSGGVVQSNSQRQVAAAAAKIGLECHLAVYHGRVHSLGDEYEASGNVLLNRIFGAHLHDVQWRGDRNQALSALSEELKEEGKQPYVIPYGVSSGLGAVGYSSAIAEIAVQSEKYGFVPDAIVHSTGSGATQAGLAVGASIALKDTEVLGIDIDAESDRVRSDVQTYAAAAADLLSVPFDVDTIEVIAGLAGPAYGIPHQLTIDMLKLAGRLEALVLDPVYSAKGLAGLAVLIEEKRWKTDRNVVFIHTGGSAANFAYRALLQFD